MPHLNIRLRFVAIFVALVAMSIGLATLVVTEQPQISLMHLEVQNAPELNSSNSIVLCIVDNSIVDWRGFRVASDCNHSIYLTAASRDGSWWDFTSNFNASNGEWLLLLDWQTGEWQVIPYGD